MEKNSSRMDAFGVHIQKKFLTIFCSISLLFFNIMFFILYFWSKNKTMTIFENSRLIIKTVQDFMLPIVLLSSCIVIVFIILFAWIFMHLFLDSLLNSLIKIKIYFQDFLKNGDFSQKLFIKSNGKIDALVSTINEARKSLGEKTLNLKKECFAMQNVEEEFVRLWRQGKEIENKELEDVIKKFKKQQRLIEKKISSFYH